MQRSGEGVKGAHRLALDTDKDLLGTDVDASSMGGEFSYLLGVSHRREGLDERGIGDDASRCPKREGHGMLVNGIGGGQGCGCPLHQCVCLGLRDKSQERARWHQESVCHTAP